MAITQIEDIYELTPLQQGMLYHTLSAPASGVYVGQVCYQLDGALHLPSMQQAWQMVLNATPALRGGIEWEEVDTPIQLIYHDVALPWQELDWQHLTPEQQQQALTEWLRKDRERGFDLTMPPLLRLTAIRRAAHSHYLLLTSHHLLLDGWSIALVLSDVLQAYKALRLGEHPQLPERPPFRDYVLWLQRQNQEEARRFWSEALRGITSPTSIGIGTTSASTTVESQPGECDLLLSKELTRAVQELARDARVTVNTVLQGMWALLLSRYSGEQDVVFGVTVAGRPPQLPRVEEAIGLFINTLPLRVHLPGQTSVTHWLGMLQEQNIKLRNYEHTPLVDVQKWSQVPQGQPLFESIFVFENYPVPEGLVAGPESVHVADTIAYERVNYPLMLVILPGPQIHLRLRYDPTCFEQMVIERLLGHCQHLLQGMSASPQSSLNSLSVVTPAEYQQIVVDWNNNPREYPERCVYEMFTEQAKRTPDATALVYEGQHLSYAELERRTDQLAAYLQERHIGPEVLVGIYMERSLELLIAILGVLKAGGAYVPLTPGYPAERLAFIIEDARIPLLLTMSYLQAQLPSFEGETVCLDALPETTMCSPQKLATPEHLAYVMYTSGSTGKPKGVLIHHRALINLLSWMQEHYPLAPTDRMLQKTPIGFDISVRELLWPLVTGACLVLARPGGHQDPGYLLDIIEQEQITITHFVPSMLQIFLETPNIAARSQHLRRIISGGEALPPATLARCAQRLAPQTHILNLYGPTEATIEVTWWHCPHSTRVLDCVPIGRPMANTRIYVLDAALQPVPVGVVGELFIGGVQLARGYFNRPDLTADRFLPDPFSSQPGARMYRAGDLARFHADGTIEYLGRTDFQVKIRGFRIELGEIETQLAQHPAVQECVVATRRYGDDTRLIAYLIPAKSAPRGETLQRLLRNYLQQFLPDYMIPTAFVTLEEIPLTPNGKTDRKALPEPESVQTMRKAYIAPRTPTEEVLASIWARILQIERVSITDSFLELGGHSLLAIQLASAVRSTFQVSLPLQEIFTTPTLRDLAATIEHARRSDEDTQFLPLHHQEDTTEYPLSLGQQRLWIQEQVIPESGKAYIVRAAIHLQGNIDLSALLSSFKRLFARHSILRTSFHQSGQQPIQRVTPSCPLPFSLLDLQTVPQARRASVLQELLDDAASQTFSLDQSPLMRIFLFREAREQHTLLLTLHHIIADGWSLEVIMRELAEGYEAALNGQQDEASSLPVQYGDYARWQREWLEGNRQKTQLAYWKEQLTGAPLALELPVDYSRTPVQKYKGAAHHFELPPAIVEPLRSLSRREGCTLFMTLLAAFNCLLSRYSRQDDIVIGSPIANRPRPELADLIGFFVNTLPLRTDLSGDPTFLELLERVRETCLAAYTHQDVSFEQILDALDWPRNPLYTPLFQVLFVLQHAPLTNVALSDVVCEAVPLGSKAAQFDLSLFCEETDNGMHITFEYDTDLFKPATIERMSRHFVTLLQALPEKAEARLSELPLLSEEERQRALYEWNNTSTFYPGDVLHKCLHELFIAQANRTPDAIALVYEQEQMSYAELDRRSDHLASHLQAYGIKPETFVGVYMERSPELLIALLGIFKAGGVYVPLIPDYPAERIAYMLEDTQMPLLLTQSHLKATLPPFHGVVLCLDTMHQEPAIKEIRKWVTAEHLAYAIYTSGSTGRPKGVLNYHRGLVNRLSWIQQTLPLRQTDRVLQKTPISFDVSLWELLWPLVTGATLILARPGGHQDPEYLLDLIEQERITLTHFVPSMLQAFLEMPDLAARTPHLRQIISSGEALTPALLARCAQRLAPQTELHNLYGPTEAAIEVSWWHCTREEPVSDIVPIGRPIANTQLYLLDSAFQPVPIGVAGELYIAGIQVARGYLNRPELTAESFLPDPFSPIPGARMYRTGDLARYRADGVIEYLGRADFQVKIRGFRIEPGEIEVQMMQHPAVKDAVVLVRDHQGSEKQLLMYVVPEAGQTLTPRELRDYLLRRLPAYMVPSAFIQLEAIPLSTNGKVDRQALLARSENLLEEPTTLVMPRDALELRLVQIWEAVFNRQPIGITENFFELGGHSLLVLDMLNRFQKAFGYRISPAVVVEAGTVERLAHYLRQKEREAKAEWSPLVKMQPNGRKTPFFCVHTGTGTVLSYIPLARHFDPDRPLYALQARGIDGEMEPLTRVEEMASYYIEAVRTVQPEGPYYIGGHSLGGIIALEMAQQLQKQGQKVAFLGIMDTTPPVNKVAEETVRDDTTELLDLMRLITRFFHIPLTVTYDELQRMGYEEKMQLAQKLLSQYLVSSDNGLQLLNNLLRVQKAHGKCMHYYYPKPYNGKITLFRASSLHPDDIEQDDEIFRDPAYGWTPFTPEAVAMYTIPGDHISMATEPHVQVLAERLNHALDIAEQQWKREQGGSLL
ncbi:amino acid adenylation domain-containing protein [Thermosporothrix hazakensis]|jgi:amino acid adenylation domain-containing protein|uniref:Amino acid adenylation domain-containing protein n=1 Tax=Thermosporothrix hazakensis TaxID=644383 RepID=A0A326U641_THEHA|nr:non-ribosomal peptide synthetase [Thermosporothrix hazakensis]PZW28424.1 amino acid adenylation domain-containing protein [Thermosporothrix hazakensis]GCE45204.1 non-ribosomal peptide synthetase [Thermosporothrix hazakensis]